MTVITITTVGYREVHELSRAGQAFTVVLLLGGVGAALYTFTLLATVVVEGGLPEASAAAPARTHARTITDHFIVCGYGRIGSIVAQQFRRQNVPFVVIERDPERVQAAIEDGALAVEADASREDVLKRVGIERARGLIAAVGTDAENVYAVLSARVLRPDLFIVGRAETEDATRKLKRAGANRVISPYQIGARADRADGAAAGGRRLRGAGDELREPRAGDGADHDRAGVGAGRTRSILEANLRQRFGVIVVGIQREDGQMEFNPEPETAMRAGDKLVVLGPAGVAEAARGRGGERALMAARVLDGTAVAHADSRRGRRRRSRRSRARAGRPPGLGIVLVGDDPASEIYVAQQAEVGGRGRAARRPRAAAGDRDARPSCWRVVDRLNRSDAHDGILVQSPLPAAMGADAEQRVFDAIDPAKDVDGFHPVNVGRLVQNRAALVPCTPSGVIELLERSGIAIAGARAVVIGRSDIVGKPMALLLLHRHATVTICHSRTADLPRVAADGGHPGGGDRPSRAS